MDAPLTTEEIAEISEFTRANPDLARLLLTAPNPRVMLEMIREIQEEKK